MKIFTIYKATCSINNKVYIGFDSAWPKRVANHKCSSQKENTKFYRAIRKHGFDSFVWEPIYQSLDFEHTLKIMEPFFIKEYDSKTTGYNSTEGGDGVVGMVFSQESRDKMSKSQRGLKKPGAGNFNPMSPETRERLIQANKGRKSSQETKDKISNSLSGKKKSAEHIEALKTRWQDNTQITCPHCNKTGAFKGMMQWHMDRCKHNPNQLKDLPVTLVCEYCEYSCKRGPNFYRYHGKNCKMFSSLETSSNNF